MRVALAGACLATCWGLPAAAFDLPGGAPAPFDLNQWVMVSDADGVNEYRCEAPRCTPEGSASYHIAELTDISSETACGHDFRSYERSHDGTFWRNGERLYIRVYSFESLSRDNICGLRVMLKYAGDAAYYQIRIVYRDEVRYSVDGRAKTQAQARKNELALSRALGLIN